MQSIQIQNANFHLMSENVGRIIFCYFLLMKKWAFSLAYELEMN